MRRIFYKIIKLICVVATIAAITDGGKIPAQADDDPDALLNYSFAVWVGSGVYKVQSADKRFAVLRAPFGYTFRAAQHDKPAFLDRLGYRLLLPAVVAVEDETETDFIFVFSETALGKVTPGVQFECRDMIGKCLKCPVACFSSLSSSSFS